MSPSWSLLSTPFSPHQETFLFSNNNTQSNVLPNTVASAASRNSMSNSLFDEMLDEHDKQWTLANLNTTTDDGFHTFSREVMLKNIESHSKKCGENQSEKVVLNIMTTDDGMRQLALDCMRRIPEKDKREIEVEGEEEKDEKEETQEEGKSKDDELDEQEKNKEGCVEEKHKLANHYMLHKLNKHILAKDITPGFVMPKLSQ